MWFDFVPYNKDVLFTNEQMRDEITPNRPPRLPFPRPEKERCSKQNPLFPVVEYRGRRPLLLSSVLERSTQRLSREVSRMPLERDANDESEPALR